MKTQMKYNRQKSAVPQIQKNLRKTASMALVALLVLSAIPFALAAEECIADVNGDGMVDPLDSGAVQSRFGSTDSSDLSTYDLNGDGAIDSLDVDSVTASFGSCTVEVTAEVDDATIAEVESMDTPTGAEVRLLQLEKRITEAGLKAEKIIAAFEEAGADVSGLQAIADDLAALNEEVQSVDPSSENAPQEFVALKYEAIGLVHDFKRARVDLRKSLDEETLAELRESFRSVDDGSHLKIAELKNRIREKTRMHNEAKLRALNILDENVLSQVKSGEITVEEAKAQMRAKLSEMSPAKKKQLFGEVKQRNLQRDVFARNAADGAKDDIQERRLARMR